MPVHEGRAESVRSLVARWLSVVVRASVPNGACSVLVLHVHVWLNAAACASSVILWWVPCAGESAWAPLDRVISCCSEASESRSHGKVQRFQMSEIVRDISCYEPY